MRRLPLVPRWHRSYVRSHPVGLLSALGIAIAGFFGLFFPDLVSDSAPSLVLPEGVLLMFNAVWLVGGGLAFVGMLRGVLRLHMPGMALVAGGLVAYYGVIVAIRGWSAFSAVFIALLGFGCALHAWFLYRYGYDGLDRR